MGQVVVVQPFTVVVTGIHPYPYAMPPVHMLAPLRATHFSVAAQHHVALPHGHPAALGGEHEQEVVAVWNATTVALPV